MAEEQELEAGERRNERLQEYLDAREQFPSRGQNTTYTNQKQDEARVRVNNLTAGGILVAAVIFDTIQAIFFIVPLVVFFQLLLGLWFMRLGVNYFTGRRAAVKVCTLFFTLVFGLVPVVNLLPEITLGAVVMIAASRIEDTVGGGNQLMRIAKRRVVGRAKIADKNKMGLARAKKKYAGKKNESKKIEQETKRGERALRGYDRKTSRESFGMGARAVFGIGKRSILETKSGATRERQKGRAGFYDPSEAEEAVDMEAAKREAVREWKRQYERRKAGREQERV